MRLRGPLVLAGLAGMMRRLPPATRLLCSGQASEHRALSKLPRVFVKVEQSFTVDSRLSLGKEVSKKLKDVLRLRVGDQVRVFDGRGREFLCEVISMPHGRRVKKSESAAEIKATLHHKNPGADPKVGRRKGRGKRDSLVDIRAMQLIRHGAIATRQQERLPVKLFFAPIKRERLRILVEKATELGVDYIEPVLSVRTEKNAVGVLITGKFDFEDLAGVPEAFGVVGETWLMDDAGHLANDGDEEADGGLTDEEFVADFEDKYVNIYNARVCEWAIGASEQSERLYLPVVPTRSPRELMDVISTWEETMPGWLLFVAVERDGNFDKQQADEGDEHGESGHESEPRPVVDYLDALRDLAQGKLTGGSNAEGVALLVGPEGGWTDEEVEVLRTFPSASIVPVSLGSLILRADTAAAHMVGMATTFLQDMARGR